MNDQTQQDQGPDDGVASKGAMVTLAAQGPTLPTPQTAIAIAIDTAYVATHLGNIQAGIYMVDNGVTRGSRNEGAQELYTVCNKGEVIGFEVYTIDALGETGDTVAITGMNVSQGNVFGSSGYPMPVSPNYWVGQAMNSGTQTYQIRVQVKTGGIRPIICNVSWDPYITAK